MARQTEHQTLRGTRYKVFDQARGRLVFMAALFSMAFLLVAIRLVNLTVFQLDQTVARVQAQPLAAHLRADIVDRNGVLLATTLRTASLYADPKMISDPARAAEDLVTVLPTLKYGEILKKLQGKKRFVWLQRNLTPRQHYAVNALGHPGLKFKHEDRRLYPQGTLAAHLTGYTDVDGQGIAGLERSFDEFLSDDHESLQLTLDIRVQHILRDALLTSIGKFNAKGGAGIVLDVKNGEVLGLVSLPDFDPHFPQKAKTQEKFNHATLGVYELGSIFKMFSAAAALESGAAKISSRFDARKPIKAGRFLIRDYHPQKRRLSLPEVFIHSSNIGTALMAEKTGTKYMRGFYERLDLMQKIDFEIPEIGAPLVPSPWRDINTLTASYGHGLAVNPLQFVAAAAAMINGGTYYKPSLVLQDQGIKTEGRRVVSTATSSRVRQLMRLAVVEGTGGKADVEGYRVGGKTGTAEKTAAGGYNKKSLLSSFVGAFPIGNPRYMVLAVVDEPKGTKASFGYATGGWTAAPVVGEVIKKMAPLYGVVPTPESTSEIHNALNRYLHKEKTLAAF